MLFAETDFQLTDDQPAVDGRLLGLRTPRGLYDDVFVRAHGSHQAENALLALTATEEFLDAAVPDDVIAEAFGELTLPGRAEVVATEPTILLDGAHNPEAAAALGDTISAAFAVSEPRVFVLGVLEPRDPAAFIGNVGIGQGDYVVAAPVNSPRSVDANRIVEAAEATGAAAETAANIDQAIDRAKVLAGLEGIVIVTGSLYAVGEARGLLV